MEEPYGDTMDEGGESEDDVSTDYGSLQLVNENFEDFEELDWIRQATMNIGGSSSSTRMGWNTMW